MPVPTDPTRTYLRVRPTDEPLSPEVVQTHFRQLHQLEADASSTFFGRLLNNQPPPTIECLLISTGEATCSVEYLFGLTDTEAFDAFERILRGLFPDTYELERIRRAPDLDLLSQSADEQIAAVEFYGQVTRRRDWQTRLTPFSDFQAADSGRVPLAAVVEVMSTADCPMVYQALLQPHPDWSPHAATRSAAIAAKQDTLSDQVATAIYGSSTDHDQHLAPADESRLDEIALRDTRHSFTVNARVIAIADAETSADQAERAVSELAATFAGVSHTCYEITGLHRNGRAENLSHEIRSRTIHPPSYTGLRAYLPWTRNRSRGIVADTAEAPNFCLLGGDVLTAAGARALAPTPGERTALPRPPFEQLTHYRGKGLLLGTPLTQDGTPAADPLVLPPALQPLHVAWFGKTGSGKSTSLVNAILTNHTATAGADILIDPKGDGMATEYLRAHYARYGTLDNVLYFDCATVLPAFGFFDIRDELAAGVPRQTAVEDTVDHYLEILTQIMGRERFEQAVRSPDVIRYLVKAMFDPVSGYEAFSHRDLHTAVRTMHERQTAPVVADSDLERMLAGVVANRARSFDEIMQGVANRIEKIPVDQRLARIFNHVPEGDDPHFDLADYLNEDVVIVFDTGSLRTEAQRVLTLVILSNLWTALRRRTRRSEGTQPLVNLYIEEAASIAVSALLKQLLAQSRGFDCSITLSMQFPAQLRSYGSDLYEEVLNNISTFLTGNVPIDPRLAERLATTDMSPQLVGNRLRALRRGQWFVSLPAGFDSPEPRPFLLRSAPLPPGDPAGDRPLSPAEQQAFDETLVAARERTMVTAGLTLGEPTVAQRDEAETDEEVEPPALRVDSALPHTKRLPPTVQYVASLHALRCATCQNRYDPDITGMKRAIACCSSLAETDRDDIPVCDLNLKLTAEERVVSDWSDRQLLFLQAVYNAQQLRYDPLEYDLLYDSMIRLQEYVGIDAAAVQDLVDADVLRHDTDHPHRLYTVTPDGRQLIGESYRQGVDYGHGAGDLEESSQHVFAVEVARQYLEQEYVADPDSRVDTVIPYYDLDDQHRLDVAGLDAEGDIVVAVEAERVNHDVLRAVPEDFDKIASCDVEEAIWVVMTQSAGHDVLQALNNPPDGEPRVTKTYAGTTPPQQFRIQTPGLTAMYPAEWLRDRLEES
ncbi:ATP-binding protein [Haloplanus aerogenes]|uniref:ATP-binding protein n=1 Tax=Haloplanus aerogenes TaxID=660522 RepID=A0A3G8QZQ7_9EURY|nr:ATP-binding protein [Haloplanus aerogenes]